MNSNGIGFPQEVQYQRVTIRISAPRAEQRAKGEKINTQDRDGKGEK
jgi:hypothetical protein